MVCVSKDNFFDLRDPIRDSRDTFSRYAEREAELHHARELAAIRVETERKLAAIRKGEGGSAPEQPIRADPPTPATARLSATINCPAAARKMETYLETHGIGLTSFAIQAQTTDRTLRSFRKTGKVRWE
jgi:hypothetical protein